MRILRPQDRLTTPSRREPRRCTAKRRNGRNTATSRNRRAASATPGVNRDLWLRLRRGAAFLKYRHESEPPPSAARRIRKRFPARLRRARYRETEESREGRAQREKNRAQLVSGLGRGVPQARACARRFRQDL